MGKARTGPDVAMEEPSAMIEAIFFQQSIPVAMTGTLERVFTRSEGWAIREDAPGHVTLTHDDRKLVFAVRNYSYSLVYAVQEPGPAVVSLGQTPGDGSKVGQGNTGREAARKGGKPRPQAPPSDAFE